MLIKQFLNEKLFALVSTSKKYLDLTSGSITTRPTAHLSLSCISIKAFNPLEL